MKKVLNGILIAVVIAVADCAMAQSGFDPFGGMRTVVVDNNQNLLYTAGGSSTNGPIDIRCFSGIVSLNLFGQTNTPGTLTCTVQTSSDAATWQAIGAYALASATAVSWTNVYYGTNLIVTNTFLLPGTITTPTAATAGWATPYLYPAQFTNTGAITIPGNSPVTIAFKADDQLRYIRTYWTTGGSGTNVSVAATLTGKFVPTNIVP